VPQRTGEEAAGAAGRVKQDFAGVRVDAIRQEGGDGARRIVLARVARERDLAFRCALFPAF
jgi:hypothetical protein